MMTDTYSPRLRFYKSSYSDRNNCVEVAEAMSTAAVRDSQYPTHGHLMFGAAEWRAFLTEVKSDQL